MGGQLPDKVSQSLGVAIPHLTFVPTGGSMRGLTKCWRGS